MSEVIHVELPRRGIGSDLARTLSERGLDAEVVDEDGACTLDVRFATNERERLLAEVTHAIEGWLGDRMLPLVLEQANGGCIVRPPAE